MFRLLRHPLHSSIWAARLGNRSNCCADQFNVNSHVWRNQKIQLANDIHTCAKKLGKVGPGWVRLFAVSRNGRLTYLNKYEVFRNELCTTKEKANERERKKQPMVLVDSSTIQASEMWLRRRFSFSFRRAVYCCWLLIICDFDLRAEKCLCWVSDVVGIALRYLRSVRSETFKYFPVFMTTEHPKGAYFQCWLEEFFSLRISFIFTTCRLRVNCVRSNYTRTKTRLLYVFRNHTWTTRIKK